MENLRTWAMMLCIASLASAFIYFLAPSGAPGKALRVVLSLFMLSVVIFPLSGESIFDIDTDFEVNFDESYLKNYEEMSIEIGRQITDSGREIIKKEVDEKLYEICSDDFQSEIFVSEAEQGQFELQGISIIVSDEDYIYKKAEIEKEIGKITGIVPDVSAGG